MPSARKKQVIQAARKRQGRGRIYLAALIVIIIGLGVGLFVYASSQSGPPDFRIAAPAGVTIYPGQTATAEVNVTAINRFSDTVRLSANASPGLTATISPANITGSGTATLTMSTTKNGTYALTLSGTSGSLTHSTAPRVATPVYAQLVTSNGTITVELYRAQVPKTVDNFVSLANSGFYTNLTWHRIISDFVIQTGDHNTVNGGGDRNTWGQYQGQSVLFEYDPSLHNYAGYLGMASTGPGVGGSTQFYINVHDNSASLDGKYAVFGKVIFGMNVANTLASTPTTNQYPNAQNEPVNPLAALLLKVTVSS